jgi:single-strand DNA-binding protein
VQTADQVICSTMSMGHLLRRLAACGDTQRSAVHIALHRPQISARRRGDRAGPVLWCHAHDGHQRYRNEKEIVGNLVESPKLRKTRSGHFVANFRIASTPRRYEREAGTWVDGDTLFVTVTCWRALGENVAQSLRKGQPVVVIGRYYQREYKKDEALRTAYELEAIAVGPDLSRGVASFERVTRTTPVAEGNLDPDGIPEDRTHEYLELADDDAVVEIDPATGEVRELAAAS